MKLTLNAAVSNFGASAKLKLTNPTVSGEPEDQLRAPFERLLQDLSVLCAFPIGKVVAVGESSVAALKTRPDYAVTAHGALVGFVELKAPGKGADPRKFKDGHDKAQWERLSRLPNILYTDGNAFSLWQNGELQSEVVKLEGDIEASGSALAPGQGLLALFESFLQWAPQAPRSPADLAHTAARLCRLLRDEVVEQLEAKSEALTGLATDWRKLLFPDATDERFADGYAQAVTFGLLMARAQNISLLGGFGLVATALGSTNSLIGAALHLLTDDISNQATLKTSLETLKRVLEVVDWQKLSKGSADAWLYFYEDFLEVYDNALRKQTGSYYTPPPVVNTMVRWVDEVLKSNKYGLHSGLAASTVTLIDPATGTGTYLLGVLRQVASQVKSDQGEGAVAGAIQAIMSRLIAFEMQLGPYAVAQLRVLAEIAALTGSKPTKPPLMYVTDTLGSPHDSGEHIFQILRPLAEQRLAANKVKRDTPVTVVLGNPPYKEKAKGKGGWVESGDPAKSEEPPLEAWQPPPAWKVGAHAKHLRNLYVYFWRWASWKVWDHGPGSKSGVVCFITVAGFLDGPGFQKMRAYLRETCDDIWVVDCTPEGHQPDVNTRIFQGVQQPLCIVLASRSGKSSNQVAAQVRFRALPATPRDEKFNALEQISLFDKHWVDCPTDWRAPFLPASAGAWATYPKLEDLFEYNGSGVMPGRTWVIAPDAESLVARWTKLTNTPPGAEQERLFHPHLRDGKPGDKHSNKKLQEQLYGHEARLIPVSADKGQCIPPVRYAFRSFDRQWIISDARLINQPNPTLWEIYSDSQIYLTVLAKTSPSNGPAVTLTGRIPDHDHYKGSFSGRVFPLWRDRSGLKSNTSANLLTVLSSRLGQTVSAEDLFAYIAAIAAHPKYTTRFKTDLETPGLRIPLTADAALFCKAADVGRMVIWLHTFGERMSDPTASRPARPPLLPIAQRPRIPKDGEIPLQLPKEITYDPATRQLHIGKGFVSNVDPSVWNYEVSGKQVLGQWFSYRKRDRSKPPMGDKRPPSPLSMIQPDHWLAEYTTDLLDLLNVLGLLVKLEPQQAELLASICTGPLISEAELREAEALRIQTGTSSAPVKKPANEGKAIGDLF